VLRDELRLEGAAPVSWQIERERVVVGQDRLRRRPVPIIRLSGRLGLARRVPEVLRELRANDAFRQRFLHPAKERLELLGSLRVSDQRIERRSSNSAGRRRLCGAILTSVV
jgi:hypothetical protein